MRAKAERIRTESGASRIARSDLPRIKIRPADLAGPADAIIRLFDRRKSFAGEREKYN